MSRLAQKARSQDLIWTLLN